MKAEVFNDRTIRTIRLRVSGVPDIDVTHTYHRRPRIFRPEIVTITVIEGKPDRAEVRGGLVLKSGKASTEVGEVAVWAGEHGWGDQGALKDAPEWLGRLIEEAPFGVTTWNEETPVAL